jgi:putative tricarboxylic transport membrane protein
MTDRLAGFLILLAAGWYGLEASRLKAGFLSGPVGPKVFPTILAIVLGVLGLLLILRTEPDPSWPKMRTWGKILGVALSFAAYAFLLLPIGFIAATTLETGVLSFTFGAKWWRALVVGLMTSLALYALFVYALNIPLPVGRVFGGRG